MDYEIASKPSRRILLRNGLLAGLCRSPARQLVVKTPGLGKRPWCTTTIRKATTP
jgi:hypothetical protein